MNALVSRRSLRLRLSRRFSTRPRLLYRLITFSISFPQLPQVRVLFVPAASVETRQTPCVIANPVFRTGAQDQTIALPGYGQAVSPRQAHLPQEMGRQGDLVLTADCAHGRLFSAADNILYRSFRDFTSAIYLCQEVSRFTLWV